MNIIFDLVSSQPYSANIKYNGGAQYVKNIFRQFVLENKKFNNNIYCTYDSKFKLDKEIEYYCLENGINMLDINVNSIEYYASLYKIEKVFIGIAQRFLNLKFDKSIKLIIVVHDLRDLEIFPSKVELLNFTKLNSFTNITKLVIIILFYKLWLNFRFKINYKRYLKLFTLAKQTDLEIWTVSNHTKYILLSNFPFLSDVKITIYWSPEIIVGQRIKAINILEKEKFFLMVSSDNWEKNSLKVIDAFTKLNKNSIVKFTLVLLGDLSSTNLYKKIKNNKWIFNFSNIDDSEIEWLYSKANALIYLSYVEGFGYPPVQSMKYGTPVLASSTSSIIEICDMAPIYCCPYSNSEILARLLYIINNDLSNFRLKSHNRYLTINERQKNDLLCMVNEIHS